MNQSETTAIDAVMPITAAIGTELFTPNTPTIGEITPATPKFAAPSSEAAVPASWP